MGCRCSSPSPDTAHEVKADSASSDNAPVPEIEKKYKCVPDNELEGYLETLQTGDVVLVNGKHLYDGYFHEKTNLYQLIEDTYWDHAAVVVRVPNDEKAIEARKKLLKEHPLPPYVHGDWNARMEYEEPVAGQLQLFQATGMGTYAYPLKQELEAQNTKFRYVGVRKLTPPLNSDQLEKVEAFLQKVWARPYNSSSFDIARALVMSDHVNAHDIANKSDENLRHIFCSELVTALYQAADLLPTKSLNYNDLLPVAFEEGQTVDRLLIEPASLGGECELIKSPATKYWSKNYQKDDKVEEKQKV